MPYEMTSMHANIFRNGCFIIDGRSVSKDFCGMNFYVIIQWSQMTHVHKRIILKSSLPALFTAYIVNQEKYALVYPDNWYDKLQNIAVFIINCFHLLNKLLHDKN